MQIFKKLSWFFKQEKKAYFKGIFALGVIAILNLFPPMIIGGIIDEIEFHLVTFEDVVRAALILVGNALIMFFMRYLWRIYIFGAAFRLERILRFRLFEHFTKMSATFFQKYRVGDLMAHATNDLRSIQRLAGLGVLQLADALMTGGSVLFAMVVFVDVKLTLLTLLPMPLMVIGSQMIGKKLHITFHASQQAFSSMNNRTHESVEGIKVTKTFGQEEQEIESFKAESEDVYKKNMRTVLFDAAFDPMIEIIIIACYVLLFVFGAKMIQDGNVTIGDLVAMVSYMNMLIWPMLAFGFLYNNVERGNVSYSRIEELLNIQSQIQNVEHPVMHSPSGDICFELNHFAYDKQSEIVLQDIHFKLKKGQTLGIAGKTGSGKTTLIKLLLHEFDHYQGTIRFGDYEIYKYDIDCYHQAFGYVPQDQFLFSASIIDNIRFGCMQASKEEVIAAAKMAAVHEDIEGFAQGYETIVGERGVSLSGGQKQRIAIARALLLNPEVLILDDSLSAVDAKTEEQILNTLKQNRINKTTIIVAHRFSAIKHANFIIVLDEGKIKESGVHNALIKQDGWYAFINSQQELYQGGDA